MSVLKKLAATTLAVGVIAASSLATSGEASARGKFRSPMFGGPMAMMAGGNPMAMMKNPMMMMMAMMMMQKMMSGGPGGPGGFGPPGGMGPMGPMGMMTGGPPMGMPFGQ